MPEEDRAAKLEAEIRNIKLGSLAVMKYIVFLERERSGQEMARLRTETEEEASKHMERAAALEAEVAALRKNLDEKGSDSEFSKKGEELEVVRSKLEEEKARVQAMKTEVESIKKGSIAMMRYISSLQQKRGDGAKPEKGPAQVPSPERILQLEAELQKARAELERLKAEKGTGTDRLDEAHRKVAAYENDVAEMRTIIEQELQRAVEREEEITRRDEEIERLKAELRSFKGER